MRHIVLSALAIVGGQAVAADAPLVRNYAPTFVAAYDASAGLPAADRVAVVKKALLAEFPEFYGQRTPEQQEQAIQNAIEHFPKMREAYLDKANAFGGSLPKHLDTFNAVFPNFRLTVPTTVLHSLGEMDGGTRELNGKLHLIFGADMLAYVNPKGNPAPLFHHELFHVAHADFKCGKGLVWEQLWREGLATYVSKAMNPAATEQDLVLHFPNNMAERTRAVLPQAWSQLSSVLDSSERAMYSELFAASDKPSDLPRRRGYYLGYLIAQEAAKTRDLPALAAMDCKQVREVIDASIAKLSADSVRNIAPEFVKVFDATAQLPMPERVAAMSQSLMAQYPEFYSRRKPAQHDKRVQRAIEGFPALRAAYVDKAEKFGAALEQHMKTFNATFPNYQNTTPIALVHSLGEMDGGPRELNGKLHLVFGADMMAELNPNGNAAPLFHHELFHIMHTKKFSCETNPLWAALWGEGLAVYVSDVMNPGASERELLLDVPDDMAAKTRASLPQSWAHALSVLDSTDEKVAAEMFTMSAKDSQLPVRRGYYLGYLVAKEAGKTRGLAELAALDCKQADVLVHETVRKLAKQSKQSKL
ncbi:hypothetical protein [Pseudoduganella sp. OTU4001]|uniref:hypothetical protein n=1 Tax=Pseudoduganella sp. OTU4001 TaxID=3043854 RepID=UPI00313F3611